MLRDLTYHLAAGRANRHRWARAAFGRRHTVPLLDSAGGMDDTAPGRDAMKWVFVVFLCLYLAALALLGIGTYGWFGQERDPLSAVFLLPLGLPWNLIADRAGAGGAMTAILAPLVNAAILLWLWKRR